MHRQTIAIALTATVVSGCMVTREISPEPVIGQDAAAPTQPEIAAQVSIGAELELSLPRSPGFPKDVLLFQTLVGRYDGRTRGFQATLSLSPERVEIILLAPSGPRIMQMIWTEEGIVETRSRLAPEDLDGVNILADIFISTWPKEAVNNALPENAVLLAGEGGREIWRNDVRVVDVEELGIDDAGRNRARLTHLERGYVLDIISEELEPQ